MAKKLNRVAYKVEPKLHAHRYVVTIFHNGKTRYFYCGNLKEVNAQKSKVPTGGVMEVYKTDHNFVKAWSC